MVLVAFKFPAFTYKLIPREARRGAPCEVSLLEIRKSQDLAKDLGGTASKAEKKICQSKIVSYIQKHNKTVITKMKTT